MESRFVDWLEAFKGDEWLCLGRQVMQEHKGEWSNDNPDGIEGDDYIPMYNFAYPLDMSDLAHKKVIRICEETSCTVLYNENEDSLYLALCGCGMDLSQDIALAYMIAYSYGEEEYGRIPEHLLFDVYKSGAFSVSKQQFTAIREKLIDGFQSLKQSCEYELKRLNNIDFLIS